MFTTTHLIVASAVIALVSYLIATCLLSSDPYINKFAPPRPKIASEPVILSQRWRLLLVEISRLILVVAVSLITIAIFKAHDLEIRKIFSRPAIFLILLYVIVAAVHYGYLGPKELSKARYKGQISKLHIRKHIAPYIARLPAAYALVIGMFMNMVLIVRHALLSDWGALNLSGTTLSKMAIAELTDLQFASIMLVDFGSTFSLVSQKYVIAALLVIIYVVIEQKSGFKQSMSNSSMDFLKTFTLLLLIAIVVFSLFVLPFKYLELHSGLRTELMEIAFASSQNNEYLSSALTVQDTLQTYNLTWLYLSILTGYGSLAALSLIGGSSLFWRIIAPNIGASDVLKILFPRYLIKCFSLYARNIGIKIN